jgi:hypothetical protein
MFSGQTPTVATTYMNESILHNQQGEQQKACQPPPCQLACTVQQQARIFLMQLAAKAEHRLQSAWPHIMALVQIAAHLTSLP